MYYIFVINDIEIGSKKIKAEGTLEFLLKERIWLYNLNTPNFRRIGNGDKVLIYLAGAGRRFFKAKFNIASEMFKHNFSSLGEKEKILFKMFEYASHIEQIEIFKEPMGIMELKSELEFIKDKKNYGLFFRQSTKQISEEDYKRVLKSNKVLIS
ncbi:EVE domain-containing protein [Bacillus cereus]|uniref:EVE domain-containing protein n=1 Tax=Bacillus cereus TaxID=1396 RepID=UPI001CFCC8A2